MIPLFLEFFTERDELFGMGAFRGEELIDRGATDFQVGSSLPRGAVLSRGEVGGRSRSRGEEGFHGDGLQWQVFDALIDLREVEREDGVGIALVGGLQLQRIDDGGGERAGMLVELRGGFGPGFGYVGAAGECRRAHGGGQKQRSSLHNGPFRV